MQGKYHFPSQAILSPALKSPQAGAQTSIFCAVDKSLDGVNNTDDTWAITCIILALSFVSCLGVWPLLCRLCRRQSGKAGLGYGGSWEALEGEREDGGRLVFFFSCCSSDFLRFIEYLGVSENKAFRITSVWQPSQNYILPHPSWEKLEMWRNSETKHGFVIREWLFVVIYNTAGHARWFLLEGWTWWHILIGLLDGVCTETGWHVLISDLG